jgi:hypothetical protein
MCALPSSCWCSRAAGLLGCSSAAWTMLGEAAAVDPTPPPPHQPSRRVFPPLRMCQSALSAVLTCQQKEILQTAHCTADSAMIGWNSYGCLQHQTVALVSAVGHMHCWCTPAISAYANCKMFQTPKPTQPNSRAQAAPTTSSCCCCCCCCCCLCSPLGNQLKQPGQHRAVAAPTIADLLTGRALRQDARGLIDGVQGVYTYHCL